MSEKLPIKNPWYQEGLKFKCTECGKCCTGKGGVVYLTYEEAQKIADHLELPLEKFLEQYTIQMLRKLALIDRPRTDACIFLKDKQCQIYKVRPTQCKTFPFWPSIVNSKESWDMASLSCEGINHEDAEKVPQTIIEEKLKEYHSS